MIALLKLQKEQFPFMEMVFNDGIELGNLHGGLSPKSLTQKWQGLDLSFLAKCVLKYTLNTFGGFIACGFIVH